MRRQAAALTVLVLCASGAAASIGEHLRSVHFNSAKPDFGTVPRRGPLRADDYDDRPPQPPTFGMGASEVGEQELSDERDGARDVNRHRLINEGDAAAIAGDLARAGRLWRRAADRFGVDGFLRDRTEIAGHRFVPAVATYVVALRRLESESGDAAAAESFDRVAGDRALPAWLQERALYQRGCVWRDWLHHEQAIAVWQEQIRRFPNGEKRAAAVLMIARSGVLPEGGDRATGRAALDQLDRSFPGHRFRGAVRGMRAKLDLEAGRLGAAATAYCTLDDGDSILKVRARNVDPHLEKRLITLQLIAYLRAFDRATTHEAYYGAGKGIARSLARVTPEVGRRFLARLVRDPELARPYLYYRLYHCDNGPRDIARLGDLADRIAGRYGRERLPASVRVRLGEVYYRQRRFRTAIAWVAGATVDPDARVRARALYVRAASLHKRGRISAARRDLETLLAACPRSPLGHGARELLALCCETQGDFVRALELYNALNYREDRAYLVDVRAPIADLERYWRTHRTDRNLMAFSIALRYLREERWGDCRRWLERVSPAAYRIFLSRKSYDEYDWQSEFMRDPRQTVERLSRLHAAARRARTRAARASALYAYAREYYTAGLLQLYNPPLWRFGRMMYFNLFWNPDVESKADTAAIQRYMYQHEVTARTRRICLDIARQYPDTPTAPYALYRAACASATLSGFNSWWDVDSEYRSQWATHAKPDRDHRLEASHLMRRLVRRYPKHPLARPARKYAAVFAGDEE